MIKLLLALLVTSTQPKPIGIVLYGDVKDKTEIIAEVSKRIQAIYGYKTVVIGTLPLPSKAYHKTRKRYIADGLLLDIKNYPKYSRIIALTDVDISTGSPNWGILGLAIDRTAVVSTYRAKKSAYVVDTMIHELGHTFGLNHCRDVICYMQAYSDTLIAHNRFCNSHNKQLYVK